MRSRDIEFSVASCAYQGARDYQEDSIRVWPAVDEPNGAAVTETVLAVLADGMGGHVSGEVASRIVCDSSVEHFTLDPGRPEIKFENVIATANQALQQQVQRDASLTGMGCTVVVAYLDSRGLRWASVGDSSLLLFRNNKLFRLNEDHSLGALLDEQAAAQLISLEEARNSPNRRSLRSALTGGQVVKAEVKTRPRALQSDDCIILASDGLETLSGDDIATIIDDQRARGARDIADKLLEEVARRKVDNQDNTSVIAICVHSNGRGAETAPQQLPVDDDIDTEVVRPLSGVEIGQVRNGADTETTRILPRANQKLQSSTRTSSFFRMFLVVLFVALLAAGGLYLFNPGIIPGR